MIIEIHDILTEEVLLLQGVSGIPNVGDHIEYESDFDSPNRMFRVSKVVWKGCKVYLGEVDVKDFVPKIYAEEYR